MKDLFSSLNLVRQMPNTLKVFSLSFLIVLTSFLIYQNFGIGLADEGFLWYGMIRTALGEVPIRDFYAYDPGRYYWGSLWFKLFDNDSPIVFRASLALVEFGGLTFALLCLRRITRSWAILIFEGLLISSWMYVHYKAFDITVSIAAVYFAILLLEKPSLQRHLIAGIFVGFAAFIGINHGLYTSASFLMLILFIWFKFSRELLFRRFLFWIIGIAIGYSPMLLMYAVIPDFFAAYLTRIGFIFSQGTNLRLPIPWPWFVNYLALGADRSLSAFSKTIYFLIFPLFNLFITFYLLRSSPAKLKQKHVLIASSCIGLTYIHFAFDRADLNHLSFAIVPLLISLISLPSGFNFNSKAIQTTVKVVLLAFLVLTTPISADAFTPWRQAKIILAASSGHSLDYTQEVIKGNSLWFPNQEANLIRAVKQINDRSIGKQKGVFIAPSWPGLYAILGKKSPTEDTYLLFLEKPAKQYKMIDRIKQSGIDWAIIRPDDAIDGRDELRFRNAYSLVWRYLTENFEVVKNDRLPAGTQLMKRHPLTPPP
jgi:hypothetical protein